MCNDNFDIDEILNSGSSVCSQYRVLQDRLLYLESNSGYSEDDLDDVRSEMEFLWNLMTDVERSTFGFTGP